MDVDTSEELLFNFDKWMSREIEDYDLTREMPLVINGQDPIPSMTYCLLYY